MPNYHLEATIIGRGKGRSVTGAASYVCGRTLRDSYYNRTHCNRRKDVVWQKIFLPNSTLSKFRDLQQLCNEIENAEVRRDARTVRQFIASLPGELPPREQVRMVHEFC